MNHTELFILDPTIYNAIDDDEVKSTCAALHQLGLYKLPYERVAVRFLADDIIIEKDHVPYGPTATVDLVIGDQIGSPVQMLFHSSKTGVTQDITDYAELEIIDEATEEVLERISAQEDLRRQTADMLITLLATKNAIKVRRENKLAKLGIGKKRADRRYRYITTISLPATEDMADDSDHPPTGLTRAPHLRRGHIRRRQHYGPKGAFVKQVWIEPVFVNADPSFVSTRKAYNVSGALARSAAEVRL